MDFDVTPGQPLLEAAPAEAGRWASRTCSTLVGPDFCTASGVAVDCSTESETVSPGAWGAKAASKAHSLGVGVPSTAVMIWPTLSTDAAGEREVTLKTSVPASCSDTVSPSRVSAAALAAAWASAIVR